MKYNRLLISALGASMFLTWGTANAGTIVGSLHDLSSQTTNTDQVCVFCHTPHGSDTAAPAPLWNKALPASGDFGKYTSSTLDGTVDLAGSVSLACLSCHDGTQAMDTVLNAPGTGGYVAVTGSEIDTGAIGAMTGTPIPVIGTNLRDDHPVSVEYAGGGTGATDLAWGTPYSDADTAYGDLGFKAVTVSNGRSFAYNSVSTNSLPLYNKSGIPFVECASCHDPHDNDNGTFLRVATASSGVCTTCHIK